MENRKYMPYWDISNQCEKEIIRICHQYELKNDISDTAFWILYSLHDAEEEMTQTDICNCMYAPRQSTNTALKKLEQDGLVEKVAVPGNQKSKYIVLTEQGRNLAEQIVVPMKQAEHDTLASFEEEEIKIYLAILQKRCECFRKLLEE